MYLEYHEPSSHRCSGTFVNSSPVVGSFKVERVSGQPLLPSPPTPTTGAMSDRLSSFRRVSEVPAQQEPPYRVTFFPVISCFRGRRGGVAGFEQYAMHWVIRAREQPCTRVCGTKVMERVCSSRDSFESTCRVHFNCKLTVRIGFICNILVESCAESNVTLLGCCEWIIRLMYRNVRQDSPG